MLPNSSNYYHKVDWFNIYESKYFFSLESLDPLPKNVALMSNQRFQNSKPYKMVLHLKVIHKKFTLTALEVPMFPLSKRGSLNFTNVKGLT